jgi:hypothetical protein
MGSIAFVCVDAHPSAIPYYAQCNQEPIPPYGFITVEKPVSISGQEPTIEKLLEAILAAKLKKGSSIVIISHGNEDGLFFVFGKAPKIGTSLLNWRTINALQVNEEGRAKDEETAQLLFIDVARLKKIKSLIVQVQQLELDRVYVRACNVGSGTDAPPKLREFFNCNTFCAPKLYDAFGAVNLGKISNATRDWNAWNKDHRKAVIEGESPDRIAYQSEIQMDSHKVKIDAFAESEAAVKAWVKTHLPPSSFTKGSPLYHAFLAGASSPLIFAGDADYRSYLVEDKKP